jgi:hypothetical protein
VIMPKTTFPGWIRTTVRRFQFVTSVEAGMDHCPGSAGKPQSH